MSSSSTKGKKKKSLKKAEEEHKKFLKKMGVEKPRRTREKSPNLSKKHEKEVNVVPTSDNIPGFCSKKEIFDYKWKKDRQENPEQVEEIENKVNRIDQEYGKGNYQYITPNSKPK